jgi:predicted AlkP superfamily phosphohydrolase/phosphomutase
VRRALVLALDSADAELIDAWMEEGHLPTLAALRRRGAWARLGTTADVLHVSAWPTIFTGATPGHHGLYHAVQVRAGTQGVHRTRPEWCALPPFWKLLDDAGRKCLVMDAFMDHPVVGFRGIQILEYGTWTWFSKPRAIPASVGRELLRRFGPYPAPEHLKVLTVPEPAWFRDRLMAAARWKGKAAGWLLGEMPWNMALIGFGEPHGAGHYLWHQSDPTHPAHSPDEIGAHPHALRDVYAAVDEAIGAILEGLDDSTIVLVMSGDGMGPNYSGSHLLPEVLHRLDVFHGAGVGSPTTANSDSGRARQRHLTGLIRQAIPIQARQAVTRCLPRSIHYWLSMKWVNDGIDWERSRAFCIPNSNEGYVRVNLEDREPRGIVPRGSAYTELLDELETRLSELIVPESGRVAASKVMKMDAVFEGRQRRHLPDLVVTWDAHARVLAEVASEACGRVSKLAAYQVAPFYTGNHRPNAFVVAAGAGVVPGSTLMDGHILDLAPTIFAILGVEAPQHFEGRAWHELSRRAVGTSGTA